MFKQASESAYTEIKARAGFLERRGWFGIESLDHALDGIFKDDLILIGAPSGAGKTQLCCNIALANMEHGKKVHYIALEAGEFEIERRLKYPLVLERFLSDPNKPRLGQKVTFSKWLTGKFLLDLEKYEFEAAEYFEKAYRDLFLFYKTKAFGLNELLESIAFCSNDTDLIIVDHVHYFDFEDENENRAIKNIAKTVRQLAIDEGKPIILIAHLRKRDKHNASLVADLDEFHGSSDLYKIATKVITMAPGRPTKDGTYETFFRIPKNRYDGGATRYVIREEFSPQSQSYLKGKYELTWAKIKMGEDFKSLEGESHPEWSRLYSGPGNTIYERQPKPSQQQTGAHYVPGSD